MTVKPTPREQAHELAEDIERLAIRVYVLGWARASLDDIEGLKQAQRLLVSLVTTMLEKR